MALPGILHAPPLCRLRVVVGSLLLAGTRPPPSLSDPWPVDGMICPCSCCLFLVHLRQSVLVAKLPATPGLQVMHSSLLVIANLVKGPTFSRPPAVPAASGETRQQAAFSEGTPASSHAPQVPPALHESLTASGMVHMTSHDDCEAEYR